MRSYSQYVAGAIRHPIGAGLAAVALVGLGILFLGTRLVTDSFLDDVEVRQARQGTHLSEMIHYSGILGDDRDDIRTRFDTVASSPEFDSVVRRAVFGLEAARFDVYGLGGGRLYSSDRNAPPETAAGLTVFIEARRGIPTSEMRADAHLTDLAGVSARRDVLVTFSLMEDAAPDTSRGGRPLAVIAVYGEVGEDLAALRTTVWYIVGVYFGGLAVVFFIVYRVSDASRRRLQAAHHELQQQYRAVRESRERMLEADEAAKRAIAEELHGAVQTKLYAVWMKLSGVVGRIGDAWPDDAAALQAITDEVDAIRENDIRQLSHRLHPGIIRIGALAGLRSLRDYYEQLLPVELEVDAAAAALEVEGISRIPERIRLAAYRIAELALGNVVKHAEASRCAVRWEFDEEAGCLVLSVIDDGVGMSEDRSDSTGIGLVTISDYADALDGAFSVTSQPGGGTHLEVRLPFCLDDQVSAEFEVLDGVRMAATAPSGAQGSTDPSALAREPGAD